MLTYGIQDVLTGKIIITSNSETLIEEAFQAFRDAWKTFKIVYYWSK